MALNFLARDPLKHVKPPAEKGDRSMQRRALSSEEVSRMKSVGFSRLSKLRQP